MRCARVLLVLLSAVPLAACGFFDTKVKNTDILGKWKAEAFDFSSVRLPLSPNLEVTEKTLILLTPAGPQEQPLNSIEAGADSVILDLKGLPIDVTFFFESRDRIYFEVPIMGTRVFYNRVAAQAK